MHQGTATDIQRTIHRASLLMMASIFLSRVIGFFREWVLAQTVGATAMTDVYLASFTIPDFLNHLMAAGALSISFVPMLSEYIAAGREDFGKIVFRALTTIMGGILLVLIVIAEVFAGELALVVAPGFTTDQTEVLTYLLRIILPAQFFFYWGGLAISVQHTHGRFLLPAIAPIVYNSAIIVFGLLLHRSHGVAGFSIGVLVGSFIGHGLLQWRGVATAGYGVRPYFHFTPEIRAAFRRYLWLTLPITLGFSLVAADEWISKYFASQLEPRALSWLSYARTEMRIPVAIVGQAAGIASFPYLARLWSSGHLSEYAATLTRELQKLWAAAPVAAIVLVTHALPITHFIYGGSRFTPQDLAETAEALRMFGIGVFFWTAQVLLARGFYACQRTWLPSILGTAVSFLAIPLYGRLAATMGQEGLALAGSIGITVLSVLLWIMLRRHLARFAPNVSFRPLYVFCGLWTLVLGGLWLVSHCILTLGLYQDTRLSALADIAVTTLALAGISILLLRTAFRNLTNGPLY